jgi:phenylacetate-CoA ligase
VEDNNKFYDMTWTDITGVPFPYDWYKNSFDLHHYTMSAQALDFYQQSLETQYLPPNKLKEYINKRFVKLVRHAYKTSAYYKALYDEHKIDVNKIDIDLIEKLPFAEKKGLTVHSQVDQDSKVFSDDKLLVRTSGSTGYRMQFYCDKEQLNWRWALWMRLFHWGGYEWGNKEMRFWYKFASTVKKPKTEAIDAFLSNRNFLPFDTLDNNELKDFCNKIVEKDPFLITGYWEAIESILKYAYENNVCLNIKSILPSTQVVPPSARNLFSKHFNLDILDKYASAEHSGIAHQCEVGDLYHVQSENVFVEVVANNKSVDNGLGEVVVTDLNNLTTPLIRYRVGDVVEASDRVCGCNRTLPTIAKPHGRLINTIKVESKLTTELELADLEFNLRMQRIADRIEIVQNSEDDVVVFAGGVNDKKKLTKLVSDCLNYQVKDVQVKTDINHFRGKRHRGKTHLTNIFNNS